MIEAVAQVRMESDVMELGRKATVLAADENNDQAGAIEDRFDLSAVMAAAAKLSVPDVRPEKVARLKAAIADGSYKVSAGKLADALIAARALW